MTATQPLKFHTAAGNLKAAASALVHPSNGRPSFDYRACGHLLQHCADHLLFSQGKQIHARLVLLSISPDNFLASKLLTFYSRCGRVWYARKLFDQIPHKNIFSFNAMLFAYSSHEEHAEAINFFSSLGSFKPALEPDGYTISCLLKVLSSPSSTLLHRMLGKEVHASVFRNGFHGDLFVANALVTYYGRAGDLELAKKVFDRISNKDIVSWNAMISGYSQNGACESCLSLYREVQGLKRLQPNEVTVVSVLHACAEQKNLSLGMEVHRSVVESGIEVDPLLYNSLIAFYAKCGNLDYARALFTEMKERDAVSYGAIISGYLSYGFVDEAMQLFQQMKNPALSTWNAIISGLARTNRHHDVLEIFQRMLAAGYRPNSVTLASVVPSFAFFSNLPKGKQIHCYAIRNNCDRNVYVASALITIYAKAGFLNGALWVSVMTKGKSMIVWTAIISAYANHGDASTALSLFDEMRGEGILPDPVTFTAVLSACAHAGLVGKAQGIFNSMLLEYGIEPELEHYACIASVLARGGMLNEAVDFVRKMPIEPNAKVWGPLLNGASISGNVEVGRFVFDRLVEIEPDSTGSYVIMANIHSQAGNWVEAEKIREKMSRMELKKVPGCSWIETGKGYQSFIAGDTSNQHREEIYGLLENLLGMMAEEGYVYVHEANEEWCQLKGEVG
ncbi:hypothetical protein ACLOJK_016586 [Asimina triloba]